MKDFVNCITDDLKSMQQWWFDDGLRLKLVHLLLFFFHDFPLIFKVSINIHEYKNKIVCIFGHGMKVLQSLLPFI